MRIARIDLVPDGPGKIEMVPEEEDDLWKAYNLIAAGDRLTATSHRRIGYVSGSGQAGKRVTVVIEIEVTRREYDKESASLRILGKCIARNEVVKIGVSHATVIELGQSFLLWKPVWDSAALEAVRRKTSSAGKMDPENSDADPDDDHAELGKEFEEALQQFFRLLMKVPDTHRAIYGPKTVEAANEAMAVQTLLITDNLIRSSDVVARQRYSDLLDSVKESGGSVCILPAMHVACQKLKQLTGVAAILRFPMPHLDD